MAFMRATNGERDPLERPWVRRALQTDLATGNSTQSDLAKKYGVKPPSITAFKKRHAARIAEIHESAADQFAGIEIAKQVNRIETYAEILEQSTDAGDRKTAIKVLRQVAEELGHLPGRITVSGQLDTQTRYTIDGVAPEDLT